MSEAHAAAVLDTAGHVSMIPAFRDMARDPYFNPLGKALS